MSQNQLDKKSQAWSALFSEPMSDLVKRYTSSVFFDKRLWQADITGSLAHAEMLAAQGIISAEDHASIQRGMAQITTDIESGNFEWKLDLEDVHLNIEARLTQLVGDAGKRLHTGRSRNDQVATDVRLWLRDQIAVLDDYLRDLIATAADRAAAEIDVLMPGYTHMQPAQPVRWSHWLLSHAWAWRRDADRLGELAVRVDVMPLGSGALAGNPFGIDRHVLAADLGFGAISANSMDAVSDRDFVAEFLFWAALMMLHLSRFAEDLIIYSSREFGFVTLADAYSTGSSLMPQKKNPDALELLRGKSGRVVGHLTGLMTMLKGLPSTYNKDLQEDKEPLFDAVESLAGALQIAHGVLSTLTIHPAHMTLALSPEMLATDLADYLVRRGVPFREAHHVAGAAVKMAEVQGVPLTELTLEDLQTLHSEFDADVDQVWRFAASVEQRDADGGTSHRAVSAQIEALRAWLAA